MRALAALLVLVMTSEMQPLRPIDPTLELALDRALQDRQPAWLLGETRVMGAHQLLKIWLPTQRKEARPEGKHARFEEVQVQILPFPGPEEAAAEMRAAVLRVSVAPSGKLEGIGDEAYIWTLEGVYKVTHIRFRKGNVVFAVAAPTLDAARGFAEGLLQGLQGFLSKTDGGRH